MVDCKSYQHLARILVGCGLLLIGAACQSKSPWQGHYHFEQDLDEDFGGVAMLVDYRLHIDSDGCQVIITGYQVDETLLCQAQEREDEVTIIFLSYSSGQTANIYGVAVYPVKGVLFTLKRDARGKDGLITQWQALQPDGEINKTGRYFSKVNSK